MKRMAFVVFLVALVGVFAFAAVGCGGRDKTTSQPQKPRTPRTHEQKPSPTPSSKKPTPRPHSSEKAPKSPKRAHPKPSTKNTPNKNTVVYPGSPWTGKTPVNILILGVDGRTNRGRCYTKDARADAIHIVSINPRTGAGTILNIPRDSWVTHYDRLWNAQKGRYEDIAVDRGKINGAMAMGGASRMVDTVRHLTGLPIHYYAVTSFCGLRDLVDRLGGIVMNIPRDLNDRGATFYGRYGCPGRQSLHQGWQRLNGCKALYFARDRHSFPAGDFDRTANQAKVLVALFYRFHNLSRTLRGFIRAVRAVRDTVKFNFRCPRGALRCSALLRLANLLRTMKASQFTSVTLGPPARAWACSRGSASAVCLSSLNDDSTDALFRDIKTDAAVNGR